MQTYYIIPSTGKNNDFGEAILVNSKTFDFLIQFTQLKISGKILDFHYDEDDIIFLKDDLYFINKSDKKFFNSLNKTFTVFENTSSFAFEHYSFLLNNCKSTIHFKSIVDLFNYVKNNNVICVDFI